jgi:allantoin racemase
VIALLNPNTSQAVTNLMVAAADEWLAGRVRVIGVTAPFGAPALRNPDDIAVAERAVAQMVAELPSPQAFILGAFGDPGLAHARGLARAPVFGIGEAGLLTAASRGPFSILTLGRCHAPAILRRLTRMGLANMLTSLEFLDVDIPDIADAPQRYLEEICDNAARVAAKGAETLLLGGAPFSGLGPKIVAKIPVLDGLSCSLRVVLDEAV